MTLRNFSVSFLSFALTGTAFSMESGEIKLSVWRKGETIGGEEFIAMKEETVDYLATLKRPTESLKSIKYNCQGKWRQIRPSTQKTEPSGIQNWVIVTAIYELKDCTALD